MLHPDEETGDEDTIARPNPDYPELAAALNAFALDVYGAAHAPNASWVFAPASLEDVVTLMAFAGDGGPTRTEFWKPLRIDPSERRGEVREGMFVNLALRHAGRSERTTLLEAARLWTRHGVADVASPMKEGVFRARAAELSRDATTEMSRAEINAWTAQQTNDYVGSIVPPAALDPAMMAVATNAAYFGCELASSESEGGVAVQVPDGAGTSESIAVRGTFGYARLEGVELVDIPVGRGLSLTLVVPEGVRTLQAVEARLASGLDRWTSALAPMPAVVRLPPWSTRSSGVLRGALRSLGVSQAFGEQAHLRMLTTKPGVHIDHVFYETLVEVSPASRGARSASPMGALPDTPREIRIDGPFVYLVRDRATRLILVMGR
jgi:serine protease inhibitor